MSSVELSEEERIFYATWGLPLEVVFKIGIEFFKGKTGTKALNITYHDKLNLISLIKQSLHGPYNESKGPQSGLFDIVGNDRKNAWNNLGQMPKDMAMRCFVDSLTTFCPLFVAHVTAHRVENEEEERRKLREIESLNEQLRLQKINEELMKQDSQERQMMQEAMIRNALNQQTINQFRGYAQMQYPNHIELQEQLIAQLQEEHYQQYMLQILQRQQIQSQYESQIQSINNNHENIETKLNLLNGTQCVNKQNNTKDYQMVENVKVNNNDVPIKSSEHPKDVNGLCVSDAVKNCNGPLQNLGQEQIYEDSVLQYYQMKIQQQLPQQKKVEIRQLQQLQHQLSPDQQFEHQPILVQQQANLNQQQVYQLQQNEELQQQQIQQYLLQQKFQKPSLEQNNVHPHTQSHSSQQHVLNSNRIHNENPPSNTVADNAKLINNEFNTNPLLGANITNNTNSQKNISISAESILNSDFRYTTANNIIPVSSNLMAPMTSNLSDNTSNGSNDAALTPAGNICRIGVSNGECGHGNTKINKNLFQEANIWTRKDLKEFKDALKNDVDAVIKVGWGEMISIRVPTHDKGSCLYWEFATEPTDIGFGLSFEPLIPNLNQENTDSIDTSNIEPTVVLPALRRKSHEEVYCGSHMYPCTGTYLFQFDNTYSFWRAKTVYYRVYYS